jgi:hypothetical protein
LKGVLGVTKTIMQQLLEVCTTVDPFFTEQQDATGYSTIISSLVRVLMILK